MRNLWRVLPSCIAMMGPTRAGWAMGPSDLWVGNGTTHLDLGAIFAESPVIYTVLGLLSLFAVTLWIYSLATLRRNRLVPNNLLIELREQLSSGQYEAALLTCQNNSSLFSRISSSGLLVRNRGHEVILNAMQSEGKRSGTTLWQRISLLNEIAVIAPMLGLLGTVLGMFYAFYDSNRAAESLTGIFDGLGVAMGTTVAGLIVAILAMLLHTTLKFRAIRLLNEVENEALSLAHVMEPELVRPTPSRARFTKAAKEEG